MVARRCQDKPYRAQSGKFSSVETHVRPTISKANWMKSRSTIELFLLTRSKPIIKPPVLDVRHEKLNLPDIRSCLTRAFSARRERSEGWPFSRRTSHSAQSRLRMVDRRRR